MDELDIKKPNKIFPKLFRTFTLYIFATLLIFFGYVQLFGDVKPNILQLPTDSTDAQDTSYFGEFVENIVNFKNVDADVDIDLSYGDVKFKLAGNVKYAEEGLALNLNLVYNQQSIVLQANYVNDCVYIKVNENIYKFDASALQQFDFDATILPDIQFDFDIKQIVNFVCEALDVDLSFVEDIEDLLGLDFDNFNPNAILEKLEIKESQLLDKETEEVTGYNFTLNLGGTIQVFLECDKNYNIKSASTNNIKIFDKDKNTTLVAKVDADVNIMNDISMLTGQNAKVDVSYAETGDELDLTGIADYIGYGQNLFENRYVGVDFTLQLAQNQYAANALIDTLDGFKLETNISDINLEIALKENVVYLCLGSVRFMFDLAQYPLLQESLNELLVELTDKQISDYVQEVLSKISSNQTDLNKVVSSIFGKNIGAFLPNVVIADENSYALLWQQQTEDAVETKISLTLENDNKVLKSINFTAEDVVANLDFSILQKGFDAPSDCYNIAYILPKLGGLAEYIKTGLFEFDFEIFYNQFNLVGQSVIDENGCEQFVSGGTFKFNQNTMDAEIVLNDVCGQKLSVYVHDNVVYVAFGNMKLKTELSSGNPTSFAEILNTLNNLTSGQLGFKLDFGVFAEVLDVLQNYKTEDYLTKLFLNISGSENDLHIDIKHKPQEVLISQMLAIDVAFEDDLPCKVDLQVYDVLDAHLQIKHVASSTIKPFDQNDYADYETNFIEGALDSLQLQEGVYAFSSDIAIRFSNSTYYGTLVASFAKTQKEVDGVVKEVYLPAISLYTTSLGLSTYVYLIDSTVYLDVNGLQISADLNTTTIQEIMDFVESEFNVSLGGDVLETATAFCASIPALDRIYGKWVSYIAGNGSTINGVQIALGNTVLRDDIITKKEIVDEAGQVVLVDEYSSNIEDYGGQSNVLQYAEDSWFYNIVMQAYIQNLNSTIVPTKVVLGANIHDPNTKLYTDYSKFWLSNEEEVTKDLNFAVYLTNISVGQFTTGIDKIFISQNNFADIYAVKTNQSNVSTEFEWTDGESTQTQQITNLQDFNSYKTLLQVVEGVYSYANGMEYQVNISGTVASAASVTAIDGDVAVQIKNLPEGTANKTGIDLFNGKELNVQGGLDIKTNYKEIASDNGAAQKLFDARHLIDILYQSNGEGLFATYAHSNFADDDRDKDKLNNNLPNVDENGNFVLDENGRYVGGNFFRAKIDNSHLSEIMAMALAFADVNLGKDMIKALSLPENTTDFSFIRSLLGLNKKTDVSDEISKVDRLLSSVENITKMIKQITLDTQDKALALQIMLDLNANDKELAGQNIAKVCVKFVEGTKDGKTSYRLQSVTIENLVMGGSTFNFTVTFGDQSKFNEEKAFDYFNKNPEFDDQGNATHIDFSEVASFVDVAVNSLNAKGILLTGETTVSITKLIGIDVKFEVFVGLDENNELYVRAEVSDNNVYNVTSSDSLTPKPTYSTYIMAGGGFDKRVSVLEYKSGELVVTQKTYGIKESAVSGKYDAIRGGKGTSDNWVYSGQEIGDNVMVIMAEALGLSNYAYDIIKYAISKIEAFPSIERALLGFDYNKDTMSYSLIINAENVMGMSGVKDMTLSIGTSKPYTKTITTKDEQGNIVTKTKTVKFIDNISTSLVIGDDIIKVPLTLSSQNSGDNYTTMDGRIVRTTEYFRNKYANNQKFYVVNLSHNGEFVKLMYCDENQQISAANFADCTQLSSYGFNIYNSADNSIITTLIISGNTNLYFKNYYALTFDTNKASLLQNGVQVADKTYIYLEGKINLNQFTTSEYASREFDWGYKYFKHNFQSWNGADENGYYNLTGNMTVSANFTKIGSNKNEYNSLPH